MVWTKTKDACEFSESVGVNHIKSGTILPGLDLGPKRLTQLHQVIKSGEVHFNSTIDGE